MAIARLKGDPKVGITGMRKRIFPDGDSMKEKVHKMIQQLVEVERFKFYKNVDWFLVLKFDNFYPLV